MSPIIPYPFLPTGPSRWHEGFPIGKDGVRQSPIDICFKDVVSDETLAPLQWSYAAGCVTSVENTGSSWKANVAPCAEHGLKGGALDGEYELIQFHAHWGKEDGRGSEHTVDGKAYEAELHLVHWNRTKYSSFAEAAQKPDGLAVLGLFIQVGKSHAELEKLCKLLQRIRHSGQKTAFDDDAEESGFDPAKLIPSEGCFWTYEGSLTTPPLYESVIWSVFKEPIEVSEEQLETMRGLLCSAEEEDTAVPMVDNFRPPCPRGERTVKQV